MSTPIRTAAFALATTAAALLGACGGGGADDAAAAKTTLQVTPTLLDDEGQALPSTPGAEPADPGARTRAGRYATAAQAEAAERALGLRLLGTRVERGTDAAGSAERAVLAVHRQQAARGLDRQTPVLVRGDDLRLAAAVADRLGDQGFTHVFLVTQ